MSCLFLTLLCGLFIAAQSAHKDRAEQLRRMKQYQLIHVTPQSVDADTKTLEFEAFGQRYTVELTRKHHSAPSLVIHSNVDYDDHRPFSSSNESCHFSVRVTNAEQDSVGSVSLCDGRGIRGRITAFGETLIIRPSAYFLDLAADKLAAHALDDELLVYRLSDFEAPEIIDNDGVSFSGGDDVDHFAERRRLYDSYSASDTADTEMAVIIGPVRTANYKEDYGDNWYSQLFLDTADLVSAVDEIYAATNWNSGGRNSIGGVGSVRIMFSEIHVVHEFTGIHYSLRPEKVEPDECGLAADEYSDYKWCYVDGKKWLGTIRSWVSSHFNTASYDNVQFITDMSFWWDACPWYAAPWNVCSRTLGWGGVGTLCKGSSSVSVDAFASDFGGNANLVGTVAHELGHNFGMHHDGQPGSASSCDAEDGLMGYGSTKDRFSSCSLDGMKDYFNGYGYGLRCLSTGWDDSVAANVDDDGSQLYGCGGAGCVYISGLPTVYSKHEGYYEPVRSTQNGLYSRECHDDHSYYKGPNEEFLCYDNGASRWFLSYTLCQSPFIMSAETGGDVLSAADWSAAYRGTFYVMGSVQFSDCGGGQAFSGDLECLESNPLGDEICVSTPEWLVWGGERTFLVLGDLCLNEKAVYHFMARNNSDFVEANFSWSDGATWVEEVDEVNYYIHYELVPLDVTADATIGRWMLTQHEISEQYLAYCDEEELADCTAGSWTVQGLFTPKVDSWSEDESAEMEPNQTVAEVVVDGFVLDFVDQTTAIRDGNCEALNVEELSNTDGDDEGGSVALAVVLPLIAVLVICCGLFAARKFLPCRRDEDKHSVPDAEAMEVEVEVAMQTDAGTSNYSQY